MRYLLVVFAALLVVSVGVAGGNKLDLSAYPVNGEFYSFGEDQFAQVGRQEFASGPRDTPNRDYPYRWGSS